MVAAVAGGLRLFHGDGAGAFGPPVTLTVSANPVTVVVADFNEDGVADIAVGHSTGTAISILNSDGQADSPRRSRSRLKPRVASIHSETSTRTAISISSSENGTAPAQRVTTMPGNGAGGFEPRSS